MYASKINNLFTTNEFVKNDNETLVILWLLVNLDLEFKTQIFSENISEITVPEILLKGFEENLNYKENMNKNENEELERNLFFEQKLVKCMEFYNTEEFYMQIKSVYANLEKIANIDNEILIFIDLIKRKLNEDLKKGNQQIIENVLIKTYDGIQKRIQNLLQKYLEKINDLGFMLPTISQIFEILKKNNTTLLKLFNSPSKISEFVDSLNSAILSKFSKLAGTKLGTFLTEIPLPVIIAENSEIQYHGNNTAKICNYQKNIKKTEENLIGFAQNISNFIELLYNNSEQVFFSNYKKLENFC